MAGRAGNTVQRLRQQASAMKGKLRQMLAVMEAPDQLSRLPDGDRAVRSSRNISSLCKFISSNLSHFLKILPALLAARYQFHLNVHTFGTSSCGFSRDSGQDRQLQSLRSRQALHFREWVPEQSWVLADEGRGEGAQCSAQGAQGQD